MSSELAPSAEPNPDFHEAVGAAVISWSRLEALMGLAILGLYEIDAIKGLVLTSNLGFKGLMSVLRIQTGLIKPPEEAARFNDLLNRIDRSYNDRNLLAHGVWTPSPDKSKIFRKNIRARNYKLVTDDDIYELRSVQEIAIQFHDLGRELLHILQKNGILKDWQEAYSKS